MSWDSYLRRLNKRIVKAQTATVGDAKRKKKIEMTGTDFGPNEAQGFIRRRGNGSSRKSRTGRLARVEYPSMQKSKW